MFRNKYDSLVQQKMKGEGLQNITHEILCATQLIVAALNEERGIGPTLTEFLDRVNMSHVLVVDGHSIDRTVEIAKNLGANVAFQDGIGKGNAIAKALQHIDASVKYVIFTDADYTYPAEYVPEMIEILERNPDVGMVCGNRLGERREPNAFQGAFYFGNKLLAIAHNLLNGVSLDDPLTGLRVIRTEILTDWTVKSQGFDIEVELNHLVERKGYKTVEVPIQYRQRIGEKKLKVKHGITILKRIMQESIRQK